jgi:SAM-dependent methyltransferase
MSELSSLRIRRIMYGPWIAQAVHVAARLGIADVVADGATDTEELAKRLDVKPEPLYRLMRALSGEGIFREEASRTFVMTPAAECLRTDGEDSVKDLVMFYGFEVYRSYGRLLDTVRTGERGFDAEFGATLWEYLKQLPPADNTFRRGMGAPNWHEQLPLPRTYDFGGIKRLVDVGGGEGTMLAATLHEHPEMQGVLVEIAAGIDRSMRHFEEAGVEDRVTLVEGSGFDELPAGDGYLLSCVLHAMDDAASLKVLGRIRDAIEPDGRLVILERVVPPANENNLAKILDLSMMVMDGGKERTEAEWHELLAAAGFKLTQLVDLPYFMGGYELVAIEAKPVPVESA